MPDINIVKTEIDTICNLKSLNEKYIIITNYINIINSLAVCRIL